MAARATAIALTGSDQVIRATHGLYRGICLRETASATAAVRVYDNASAASGTLLDVVALAANGSASLMHEPGIQVANGIYVDIVSGTVEGSVRVG
jgi:hypothetical protein